MQFNTQKNAEDYKKECKPANIYTSATAQVVGKIGNICITAKRDDYNDELQETAEDRKYFGTI